MQDATPGERMEKAVREYFKGEKTGGFVLLAWALMATLAAWFLHGQFVGNLFQGIVPPLVALALVQLAVGAAVCFLTDSRRRRLLSQLAGAGQSWFPAEVERMERVLANFEKVKTAEQLLLLLGFGFLLGGVFFGAGDYMAGTGVGLCIQSAFSLVFDLFASLRANLYRHELKMYGRD
ncbi:MAG: hypothetical protein H6577_02585 [Lewinellaceae bacterium]|nr:hypothetical protein [Saprospiraceae bacterium]MCB9336996.1 hypothetical protein [Lewinellaceae bacterium]